MKVFILGCGRMGAQLAKNLDSKGHSVTVLDTANESFARLGPRFNGRTVHGDGLETDVLEEAGVGGSDVFIACTSGDNRNLTASQYARELFGVPRVISRVSDPLRGEIYAEMGLQTISPTVLGSQLIYDTLLGRVPTVDCD
ncbi:MAG: TrkA-N domain protein [Chloroflexi bacterium]|nr:TrkA-N domain protein [Chloroflexota bacterium]